MANIFRPEPIVGGDLNIWGNPELAQNRIALGIISCQLYDDAGTLKITKGKIGLIDSSVYGTLEIDTITTISIAGITNENWFKVEISRTGTTPVIEVTDTDTGVDTDPASLPGELDDDYDAWKNGIYIDSEKRCIALGYKDDGGNLAGIINVESGKEGYHGKTYSTGSAIKIDKVLDGINEIYTYEYAGLVTHALPALSGNEGRIVTIHNSGTGIIAITTNGAETINGLGSIRLRSQYDFIRIIARENEWVVLDSKITMHGGMINTAEWRNRHLGWVVVDYDNLVGSFLVGEIITEAISGNTGKIIQDSGTTLTLIEVTGGGVFTDDREITGGTSGATADVDEPGTGSTKDLNSNCIHNLGINIGKIKTRFLLSTDGTYTNAQEAIVLGSSVTSAGMAIFQLNTNTLQLQSAALGILLMNADGTMTVIDTEDYYYEIILEIIL